MMELNFLDTSSYTIFNILTHIYRCIHISTFTGVYIYLSELQITSNTFILLDLLKGSFFTNFINFVISGNLFVKGYHPK